MCPEFSGILSSSMSLGVMPPALALASLVRVVWYGGVPSSAALTPAAVTPLVAPQVSELESSTLPSVMPSQPGLGLSLSYFPETRGQDSLGAVCGHEGFVDGQCFSPSAVGHIWWSSRIPISDQRVRDRRAYAHLMISEARRHGGSNWLDYECVFRRQAVLDTSLKTLCTLEFRQ